MTTLICGSMAFDTIMNFNGRFADQILPEQLHILNVSFLTPTLRRDFGGCAGNIAYALKLLGGDPLPIAAVGSDAGDYLERLQKLNIDTCGIRRFDDVVTARATIMTDRDNNQITAFHPGAMERAHLCPIPENIHPSAAIISPDGKQAMIDHAQELARRGIPFIFDPGQGLPMFDAGELKMFIDRADWIVVNDYEGQLLAAHTQQSLSAISLQVKAMIVTTGAHGCDLWQGGRCSVVAGEKAEKIVDPTGCGDAWRGGFLYGLTQGWELEKCIRLAHKMGAIKIASPGAQNYQLPPDFKV